MSLYALKVSGFVLFLALSIYYISLIRISRIVWLILGLTAHYDWRFVFQFCWLCTKENRRLYNYLNCYTWLTYVIKNNVLYKNCNVKGINEPLPAILIQASLVKMAEEANLNEMVSNKWKVETWKILRWILTNP